MKEERPVDKEVRYSDHLRFRLRLRKFNANMPRKVLEEAEELFLDTATGKDIAVAQAQYAGKLRELAVAFIEKSEYIEIITIHPLKPGQKARRIASGRWVAK